ncbi:hypothetical protein BO94DRAFT_565508 [Aspergillus sclerotioniger CBS 115572]|uniref:NADH-cytochrome b5 reductase 2 n=1 Tax=Aspergillus sclerotioniger CBS 115572 TaxID=1450535 RepID=A0A317WWF1_9EURO|nr:hypothetical protein BO94DRAFT_565508 [Aspergillus sclerotioniger CBS 115572]PWY88640.1 hypothetical protein BO94DRAFT_565508 [Aspergillus sclerotioniger CBS 115572]
MTAIPEYTSEEVAAHRARDDLWVTINGKVYDVTEYVRDHPGGPDVLIDVAGADATEAYEDVGHSEDADEILKAFLVGTLKNARERTRPKSVRLIQPESPLPPAASTKTKGSARSVALATVSVGSVVLSLYFTCRRYPILTASWPIFTGAQGSWRSLIRSPQTSFAFGGFYTGFAAATAISSAVGAVIGSKLSQMTQIKSGFTQYPPLVKRRKVVGSNPHLAKGFLDPKEYKSLPLIRKDTLSPNVFKFVFQLPNPQDVVGLPIGQHVAIRANVNGTMVSRSYTPTSNNLDKGVLELVIKCYPDGMLTGQHLANLKLGDTIQLRGPKGAMKYTKGLCTKIGMIAGGTGITPMYQLIRAICEDATDLTEISLIYANRTEEDILLRRELDAFAQRYPRNLKIWYMLDSPSQDWPYGKGYVTSDIMKDRLPSPSLDTKIMLCGPPGMVNASKKALVSMGFQAPGAVAKMSDQVFCF